ncbi:MAG TPA: 6-phosphogluconolactonase [Chromatiaceae bacterium]|nr:6-phosphogluconolactonase [Chromatiaceae bacterium]
MSWRIVADAEAVAREAVQHILADAKEALDRNGRFSLVLAGGSTPARAYRLLAEQDQDWSAWHFYFGDERCLPVDDPERNSVMAQENLFRHISLRPDQIHIIPAETGAETAAALYAQEIAPVLPFDLVLLGLGEDGHTASLFPGHEHPEDRLVVAVQDAPKPPPDRVSLNYGTLAAAGKRLFLISGKGKSDAVRIWRAGQDIPAARLPESEILIDEAAWHE